MNSEPLRLILQARARTARTLDTTILDLCGNSVTITTRIFSDSQPGPNAGDYILYHQDLAISAVKQ